MGSQSNWAALAEHIGENGPIFKDFLCICTIFCNASLAPERRHIPQRTRGLSIGLVPGQADIFQGCTVQRTKVLALAMGGADVARKIQKRIVSGAQMAVASGGVSGCCHRFFPFGLLIDQRCRINFLDMCRIV